MKYNVLLFDADGTLFDFHKAEEIAFSAVLVALNVSDHFDTFFPIYEAINKTIWRELELGKITQEKLKTERFKRFLDTVSLNADEQQIASIFMDALANASILYDGAYDLIQTLSREYKIAIVTNGLKEVQNKRIRQSVLAPFLCDTIISDEINIQKPDPRIIEYALKQLNHSCKSDVLMIGDSLTSDILGGINAAIDTVWYNPTQTVNRHSYHPTYTITHLYDIYKLL